MTSAPRKIHAMVLRNYLGSISICFLIVVAMAVMVAFDLEDQIFENQVSIAADELASSIPDEQIRSGMISGLEMQYYNGVEAMPSWLSDQIKPEWKAGEYEIFGGERGHFHIAVRTKEGTKKQYLLFNARPYVRSTTQILGFIFFIAILGGLMLLVVVYFLLRMTRRMTVPIEKLAGAVASGADLEASDLRLSTAPAEIGTLARAIADKDARIASLMERERQFNRDVSHELRTPLAVAMGAAEIIEKSEIKSPAFNRLQSSLGDMQLLTEGILWLARSPEKDVKSNARKTSDHAIEINRHLLSGRNVEIETIGDDNIEIPVPEAVAQVIIGNLVRNAFSYTKEGRITLTLSNDRITIRDSGVGYGNASRKDAGFGVGLSLVKRLCSHFGLQMTISPTDQKGTEAVISW